MCDWVNLDGFPYNLPFCYEATVKAINEIGHALGKRTVAEFVESEAICQRLTKLGVDYVQGFGIARPKPIDVILE